MNHRTTKWQALCVILFFLTACTKIDSTKLGSDLIPAVDNVNTFETDLDVVANNYIGTEEYRLNAANPHMVGAISQDPVFGKSRATMFFEMKPTSYPYIFANYDSLKGTNVGFDSAVLILSYYGYYGDSSAPVNLKLYEVDKKLVKDSSIKPQYTLSPDLSPNTAKLWGTKTVQANRFKDSIPVYRDDTTYVTNQLRIRLDDALAKQLFQADTFAVYQSDSLFKEYLPGFALEADPTSKTLLYFNLSSSKIEFYYKANPKSPAVDTTSASFSLTALSGHAVKFENDRSGAEVLNYIAADPVEGKEKIFLQTSPGVSATIHIKGLDTFKMVNRVIHRAELRITQLTPLGDKELTPPRGLYLDVIDSLSDLTYKGIPYDLDPFGVYYCYPSTSGINFTIFGGLTTNELVGNSSLAVYRFNISRYLQAVVSHQEPVYDFRLSAPFYTFYKNCANNNLSYPQQVFPFTSGTTLIDPPGMGRVVLAGSSSNVSPEIRMKLRIIYSKL